MDRSHAALFVGVLLLANPLYVDAFVPDPTHQYEVNEFEPETTTLRWLAAKTRGSNYRGPTVDLVHFGEQPEEDILQRATEEGYEAPADDVPAEARNLANDQFVVAEVDTDEWQAFRIRTEKTNGTFRLTAERTTARALADALAVPVSDAPPRVQQLVREGHLETREPVRSVVFVDGERYHYLDRDGVEVYQGPFRALPWIFGIVGTVLVCAGLYAHARTAEPVNAARR